MMFAYPKMAISQPKTWSQFTFGSDTPMEDDIKILQMEDQTKLYTSQSCLFSHLVCWMATGRRLAQTNLSGNWAELGMKANSA
jgi:hypothetical protein